MRGQDNLFEPVLLELVAHFAGSLLVELEAADFTHPPLFLLLRRR